MEAHQLQLLTSFSVPGALGALATPVTRERTGGAPSERRLSLALAARKIQRERERESEGWNMRASEGAREGARDRARERGSE
jgi:hypothetical protein